ncbi:MAG: deoxyguanosinetriphosphate triphosphohydrolase [Gammaproteobacteria bacterium]|nr:deoxyguanosinetriphosphate triphosphohydrolase [Gammaproteobacteria bacterium]
MRGIPASDPVHKVQSTLPAPYGAHESGSRGRMHAEAPASHRGEYRRDRERIIHSTAFRRLEYKTQLFVNHEGDLYRTRLTHSIEVAQVARSIAYRLKLNEPLCEAIALAHDLGHTPFGHAGQDALNRCMQAHGGFEHNLQSLRVVDLLELKYPQFPGLNLTFETREGILKHCSKKNARTLGPVGQRFLERTQPGLEAQLANIADEIAYTSHDIDDGLRANLITVPHLREVELFDQHFDAVEREFPKLGQRRKTYETIRRIRNQLVANLISASQAAIADAEVGSIDEVREAPGPLIRFSGPMREKNQALKHFLREHLYRHERVHRMNREAAKVVADLYAAFLGDARLMPDEYHRLASEATGQDGDSGRARVISDYISGMTDRYAIAEHWRIFNEKIF